LRRQLLHLESLENRTLPSFLAPVNFDTGTAPHDVVVGDFAHNGHLDIATANAGNNTVSVLLGNGDGTFQAAVAYPVGTRPDSIAVGDFNGDGKLDLAVADYGYLGRGQGVSVLLGNGDGTFQAARSFAAGSAPVSVVVADFNSDGNADLAVGNDVPYTGGVNVLLGNGDGTFQAPIQTAVGNYIYSVAVADFNGDHKPDLVVSQQIATNLILLLGNGDGHFRTGQTYTADTGVGSRDLATGDFNGDGNADVAIATTSSGIQVFLGNGNGTLGSHVNYGVVGGNAVVAADVNGDGNLDLVEPDTNFFGPLGSRVFVLLGNGNGTFQLQHNTATADTPLSVAVGDLNGDGHVDLVTANFNGNDVSVRLGNGDGTFASTPVPLGFPGKVAVGDLNHDGALDVVGESGRTVTVTMGNGDGTFQSPLSLAVPDIATSVALADLTGDGNLDIIALHGDVGATSGATVYVLLGNGDGTFQPAVTFAAGNNPVAVAVGDLNGDGVPDLVVADAGGDRMAGGLSVLLGNGDGTFQAPQTYLAGAAIPSVALGDLNNDGKLDLAVANYGTYPYTNSGVSILLGNGDGTFQTPVNYGVAAGTSPTDVVLGDTNGDGNLDVGVLSLMPNGPFFQPGFVNLLLGNGDGSLQTAKSVAVGPRPFALALGDYNNDGNLDLAVAGDFGVRILYGNGHGGGHTSATTYGDSTPFSNLVAGDFNGDGYLDLLAEGDELLLNAANGTRPDTASGTDGGIRSLALATATALGHSASPAAAVLGPTTPAAGGDGPNVDPEADRVAGEFEGFPAAQSVRGLPEASPGVPEAPVASWPEPLATDLLGPEATVPAQPLG
jgi:hypothetical protein